MRGSMRLLANCRSHCKETANLIPSDIVTNNQLALNLGLFAGIALDLGRAEELVGEASDSRSNNTRNHTTEDCGGAGADSAGSKGAAAAADDAAWDVRARSVALWSTWHESVLAALERSGGGKAGESEGCGELHFADWVG